MSNAQPKYLIANCSQSSAEQSVVCCHMANTDGSDATSLKW